MNTFTNFVLNTFASILSHATSAPDVEQIHTLVDRFHNRSNESTNNNNNPPRQESSVYDNMLSQSLADANSNDSDNDSYHSAIEHEDSDISNDGVVNNNANAAMTSNSIGSYHGNQSARKNNHRKSEDDTSDQSNSQPPPVCSFIDNSVSNSENVRFPDGNKKYNIKGETSQIGWATVQYGQNSNSKFSTYYKKCLGVFHCPEEGCLFRERPKLPTTRKKDAIPLPGKVTHCKIHPSSELVHVPCDVQITVRKHSSEDYVSVDHKGTHNHAKPPIIHPTEEGKKAFSRQVRSNPTQKPISMVTGTSGQDPIYKQDRAFINIDRVRQLRRTEMREMAYASPEQIAAFDRDTKMDMITESSIRMKDGCIICQTELMRKVMNDSQTASQTDTIEGFVLEQTMNSVNLTVTSTFCHLRNKWVPTQFGILFGKSQHHYQIYFYTLLRHMKYDEFDQFVNNYMGMVCDFSDAERKGFEGALSQQFRFGMDLAKAQNVNIEAFYAFCTVHFDRSECRIRRNHAVVPPQKQDDFKAKVHKLKEKMTREEFDELVNNIKTEFPKCKKWLDWYLHPDRAKMIFPTLAEDQFPDDNPNTNAQESMGRTIQISCEYDRPTIAQTYFHLFQLAAKHDFEYSLAVQGEKTSWGNPRVRQSKANDGRAPDTTDALLDLHKKKAGRPRNARNKAPSGESIVDLTLSINWSFELRIASLYISRIKATMTCALDTVLMGLFFIRKFEDDLLLDFKRDKVLDRVLDLIQVRRGDEARQIWIEHTEQQNSAGGSSTVRLANKTTRGDVEYWNCAGTISDQLTRMRSLFQFQIKEDYEDCSKDGFMCANDEEYQKEENVRVRNSRYIGVPTHLMHDIQKEILDKYYNSHGKVEQCGSGLKNNPTDKDGRHKCEGIRMMRCDMLEPLPPLLMVDQMTNPGVTSHDQEKSQLTSMSKIEPHLKINGTSYVLVQACLSNDGHFRGVTVIKGKYLLYDGMLEKRLRWIQPSSKFEEGYYVSCLWYRKCTFSEAKEAQQEVVSESVQSSSAEQLEHTREDSPSNLGQDSPSQYQPTTTATVTTSKPQAPLNTDGCQEMSAIKAQDSSTGTTTMGPKRKRKKTPKGEESSTAKRNAKKKRNIPMGVSVGPVSDRGVQPKCQYCRVCIARGEWHTIRKSKKNEQNKNWEQTEHFHFGCFNFLSHEQREQLVAIMNVTPEIDENIKSIVFSEIERLKE